MPASRQELQVVVVDTESGDHDALITKLIGSGLTQTRPFTNPDEAKVSLMQFGGPTLVLFYLPHSAESQVNYTRFFRRGVTKQVEIVFVAEQKTSQHIEKAYRDLGALDFLRTQDPDTIVQAVQRVIDAPGTFKHRSGDARMSTQDVFAKLSINVGGDSGEFQSLPIYQPDEGSLPAHLRDAESKARPSTLDGEAWLDSALNHEQEAAIGAGEPKSAPKLADSDTSAGHWPAFAAQSTDPRAAAPPTRQMPAVPSGLGAPPPTQRAHGGSKPSSYYIESHPEAAGFSLKLYVIVGAAILIVGVLVGLWWHGHDGKEVAEPSPGAGKSAPTVSATPLPPPPAYVGTPIPRAAAYNDAPTARPILASTPQPTPARNAPSIFGTPPPGVPVVTPIPARTVAPAIDLGGARAVSLAQLRRDWSRGSIGVQQSIVTDGVVTIGGGGFEPDRNQFVLQFGGAGLLVEDPGNLAAGSPLMGAHVRVRGLLEENLGMLRLRVTNEVEYLPVPATQDDELRARPTTIGQLSDELESMLVELSNLSLNPNAGTFDPRTFEYRDAQGLALIVQADDDTNVQIPLPERLPRIAGILFQRGFDGLNPLFVLMPRSEADITR